jgi:predicted SnoaL-like aldol condensation-catalyzing enzyme
MRRILVTLVALALLGGPAFAATQAQMEQNKKTVEALYDAAFNKKDMKLAETYMGPYYKQHNPFAKDGAAGLAGFVDYLKAKDPSFRIQILRVFADGDYVITHVWSHDDANPRGGMAMDIFRLENGKVVEHWDVNQQIPAKSMNDNGMK